MGEFVEFSANNTTNALQKAGEHFSLPISQLEVEIISTGSGGFLGMFAKRAIIKARPSVAFSLHDEVASILGNERRLAEKTAPQTPAAKNDPQPPQEDKAEPSLAAPDNFSSEDLISQAEDVVRRLAKDLVNDIKLQSQYVNNQLTITFNCSEPGTIIGRRAQLLDSLQYLAARIVSHRFGRSIALVLDVEGYRLRQQRQLEETALKLAQKVEQQGRSFTMGPLNTDDRRVVHRALKGRALQTYSKGQGEFKRLVIAPLKQNANKR